jgi:ribosomal protein L20
MHASGIRFNQNNPVICVQGKRLLRFELRALWFTRITAAVKKSGLKHGVVAVF